MDKYSPGTGRSKSNRKEKGGGLGDGRELEALLTLVSQFLDL